MYKIYICVCVHTGVHTHTYIHTRGDKVHFLIYFSIISIFLLFIVLRQGGVAHVEFEALIFNPLSGQSPLGKHPTV